MGMPTTGSFMILIIGMWEHGPIPTRNSAMARTHHLESMSPESEASARVQQHFAFLNFGSNEAFDLFISDSRFRPQAKGTIRCTARGLGIRKQRWMKHSVKDTVVLSHTRS